jgi:hypothetical protein
MRGKVWAQDGSVKMDVQREQLKGPFYGTAEGPWHGVVICQQQPWQQWIGVKTGELRVAWRSRAF